jgi:voltage-gated potassium channel
MATHRRPDEKKYRLSIKIANGTLFIMVLIILFVVPVIPLSLHRYAYSFLFTTIILAGTQVLSKKRKITLTYAIIAITVVWIGDTFDLKVIKGISKGINVILFIIIVFDLVKKVSQARMVSPKVILEAINGYLMIGLVFSIAVAFLTGLNPGSFSFDMIDAQTFQTGHPFYQYIYYTFITLTTVGYGDIVPLTPVARSLSVLISVTGQLYIAVVIALLVGKYISQEVRSEQ